jgi:hypothetical protein
VNLKKKKPDEKDQLLFDFTYMKCPEKTNLKKQKKSRLLRAEGVNRD